MFFIDLFSSWWTFYFYSKLLTIKSPVKTNLLHKKFTLFTYLSICIHGNTGKISKSQNWLLYFGPSPYKINIIIEKWQYVKLLPGDFIDIQLLTIQTIYFTALSTRCLSIKTAKQIIIIIIVLYTSYASRSNIINTTGVICMGH